MNKQNFVSKTTMVTLLSIGSMVMVLPVGAAAKSSGESRSYSSYKSFSKKTLVKASPVAIAPVAALSAAPTPPAPAQAQAPAQAPRATNTVSITKPSNESKTPDSRATSTVTVTKPSSDYKTANPYSSNLNNKAGGSNYSSVNRGYNVPRTATTRYIGDYDYDDDCMSPFYHSQLPVVLNEKLTKDAVFLCFDGFSVLYSPVSRTPLWSAEYLTPSRLMTAKLLDRVDDFHEEFRLSSNARAALSDYSGSGFDRGHLAPNADMSSRNQQSDSFSLANIVPQAPELNRGSWADLEKQVRTKVFDYGDAYVVTGVTFTGASVSSLKSRVLVPNALYKIIYYPTVDKIEAFYAKNTNSSSVQQVNPTELINLVGINPFPTLLTAKPIEQDTSMVDNTVIHNPKQVDESSDTEDGYLRKILMVLGFLPVIFVISAIFSKFKP